MSGKRKKVHDTDVTKVARKPPGTQEEVHLLRSLHAQALTSAAAGIDVMGLTVTAYNTKFLNSWEVNPLQSFPSHPTSKHAAAKLFNSSGIRAAKRFRHNEASIGVDALRVPLLSAPASGAGTLSKSVSATDIQSLFSPSTSAPFLQADALATTSFPAAGIQIEFTLGLPVTLPQADFAVTNDLGPCSAKKSKTDKTAASRRERERVAAVALAQESPLESRNIADLTVVQMGEYLRCMKENYPADTEILSGLKDKNARIAILQTFFERHPGPFQYSCARILML
jgi:hypothetical protein